MSLFLLSIPIFFSCQLIWFPFLLLLTSISHIPISPRFSHFFYHFFFLPAIYDLSHSHSVYSICILLCPSWLHEHSPTFSIKYSLFVFPPYFLCLCGVLGTDLTLSKPFVGASNDVLSWWFPWLRRTPLPRSSVGEEWERSSQLFVLYFH